MVQPIILIVQQIVFHNTIDTILLYPGDLNNEEMISGQI